MDLLSYLIKVNVAFILLYLFYFLFFKRDTFFRTKRIIFLVTFLFALIYPFIYISDIFQDEVAQIQMITLPEFVVGAQQTTQATTGNSWMQIMQYVYLLGIIVFLGYFFIQLISVVKIIYQSKPAMINDTKVRISKNIQTPFSFFNQIVFNPDLHEENEIQEILLHEKAHVKQGHSLDVLLSELICIFCWFNPFVWLIKKEMRINLEYLADEAVTTSNCDLQHYQLHLLQLSYPEAIANISNKFNVSPLKKRIQMMNKRKTSQKGLLKYMLLLPLVGGLLFVNNMQAQQNKKFGENVPEVVVVGYNDSNGKQENPKDKNVYEKVEEVPQFPGGQDELMKYLSSNLRYPESAAKSGTEGRVVCRFIIRASGNVDNVEVLKGVSPDLDAEAVRIIQNMPQWTPGKEKGKAVDVYFTIPIAFRLSSGDTSSQKETDDMKNAIFEVDGKVLTKEEVAKLDPDKIESIEVLKNIELPNGEKGGKVIIKLKK